MAKQSEQIVRVAVAVVLIALAVVRLAYYYSLSARMDGVFLILIGAGLLVILIPVQYLKSFKAGGVELTLDRPQVQVAISGLGLSRIQDEKIHSQLSRLQHQLDAVRGSRVLWIDDRPHGIIAERRLLRALGIEVLPAISSEVAEAILQSDNDFDLIISDVQRRGDSYLLTGGVDIHEGVNFIVKLRRQHTDPVVRALPVLFYAAYDWERLVAFTTPARLLYPPPEIANSAIDLIPKAVKLLAEARTTPISAREMKKPSSSGGVDDDYNSYGGEEEVHEGEEEENFGEEEEPEESKSSE